MSIHKLMRACLIGIVGLSGLIAQAEDTFVTNNWNVIPWNVIGPTLESFTTMPGWAKGASNTNNTGMTERTDNRFWTNSISAGNKLTFSTAGITNVIAGAKIYPGTPIFVDMRCKIYQYGATPPTLAPNTIFCFYANQKSNLVAASSSASSVVTQCKTNLDFTVTTNEYYSVMIRFDRDTFDLFFENNTTPALSLSASNNTQISKMIITGDGQLDDLYISYGDPRRSSTNSLIALNEVDGWSLTPSAEELVVKNWLANYATSGTYSKESAEKFYLINATNSVADQTFAGELGIGSIDYKPSSTSVTVVVTLKTGASASTKKTGKINGVLKLKGATTYDDAKTNNWSGVLDVVKIGSDDFSNGLATYTFALTNETYKFFLPVIKPDIK